jgi:isopenicillin N synthase-like dioxygenase
MSIVPIVDLQSSGASAAVDDAMTAIGFFQVVGHDVDRGVIDALLDAMNAFFALPLDVKQQYRPPAPEVNNGYSAIGAESLAYSLGVEAPPDLFEAFNLGPEELDTSDPAVAAERHRIFHPNIWPVETPELRHAGVAYFAEARRLAHRLTSVCASGLGLDADFFEPFTTHSTDTLRLNWYHRDQGSPEPLANQQRMGAHTDYGIVTVLYSDAVAGLEVLAPNGAWVSLVPEPGAYLVNIGDLMAQWTNDRWRSTLHRVVPPPSDVSGGALRRSMAFFHDGNWDAMVECLPTCCDAAHPARYRPVRALDHLMNKLLGGRTMEAAAATDHVGDRLGAVTDPV